MQDTASQKSIPYLRWWICALLFFATTINYVDRTSLAVLKPILSEHLNWNNADFGWITFAFSLGYALFFTVSGKLIDTYGVRLAFAVAVVAWSAMAGAHAFASSVVGFAVARFL